MLNREVKGFFDGTVRKLYGRIVNYVIDQTISQFSSTSHLLTCTLDRFHRNWLVGEVVWLVGPMVFMRGVVCALNICPRHTFDLIKT
jgi:hypothetical protein